MINIQEINDNHLKDKSPINNNKKKENERKSKEESIKKSNEEKEFFPILEKLNSNNNKNKKRLLKDIIEEQNPEKSDINEQTKLPYMRLTKELLDMDKYNCLLNLQPFFSDFNNHMEKKGEEIVRDICNEGRDEEFDDNNVIFRYGDEADRYFIILDGGVTLYFPFTEVVELNIDEYYIYILRLKRYNEIEMLNNVLLLNNGQFMFEFDESFDMDEYLIKLYNTYLKLKFDPSFLYKNDLSKKKKIRKIKRIGDKKSQINILLNNKNNKKKSSSSNKNKFSDENRFDNSKFPTFNEREVKELVLRIGEEIVETMKWAMPEKIYDIIEETKEDTTKKKLINIPSQLLLKYKNYNANNISSNEYQKRILPISLPNKKLKKKSFIIMKYLFIDIFKKGQYFGDFSPESLSLFSPTYLSIAKNARINLKIHNFHQFRNMTAISTSLNINKDMNKDTSENNSSKSIKKNNDKIHLISFNKKIFLSYFSKFNENMNNSKKNFLLNNSLFLNSTNKNLIKTYSFCFREKKIKEGECIITENNKIKESNIYIYFIIKGEFQVNCKKSISQIDEIIKLLGHEKNIPDTFPKILKDLINTPYYNELIRKPLNLKLNYLNKNDIVGFSEIFKDDEYFYNVQCTSSNAKIYYVDIRIIKLLVDSEQIINNNKNIILYHKYEMLSDILLKQRKIYFDSFFNAEKYNIENLASKNDITNENDEINNKNDKDMIGDFKNNNVVIIQNLVFIPKINRLKSAMGWRMTQNNGSKIQSMSRIHLNKTLKKTNSQENIIKNLGDLDKMLANLSGRFTLKDKRIERSLEFRKKYQEKMEKLEKEMKLKKEEELKRKEKSLEKFDLKGRNIKDLSFHGFIKCTSLFNKMFREMPLLPNKNNYINSEGEYKFIIPYKKYNLKQSNSVCEVNPLAYDDFNRKYNTHKYFNIREKDDKKSLNESYDTNKEHLDYIIHLKSDKKLIKKVNYFVNQKDFLTRKLRCLYQGKYNNVLFNEKKLKKIAY